jgi:MFS family permease
MVAATDVQAAEPARGVTRAQWKVVLGGALGTIFEFYDFVLFGFLSPIIAAKFFAALSPSLGFVFALLAFAVAYAVRPLGAFVFGRMGDIVGRKYTFLVTVSGMGIATFVVGLLPTNASWGIAAPVCLMALRLLQGISLGGEFGGAASYVAEHAPHGRVGYYTSWIQSCASAGVVFSLVVITTIRTLLGASAFAIWGWRLPFLFSVLLLAVSLWIRARLNESPVYQRMKAAGKTTRTPLRDLYGSWKNVRMQLALLFGPVAGTNVLGVLALIYVLVFLLQTLRADPLTVNWITCAASLLQCPSSRSWVPSRTG